MPTTSDCWRASLGDYFKRYRLLFLFYLNSFLVFTGIDTIS
ncbi:hypothetical protein ACULNC_27310 [Shigella flexneri]